MGVFLKIQGLRSISVFAQATTQEIVLLTVRTLSGFLSLIALSFDGEPFKSDFGILVEDTRRIGHWSMLRSTSCKCKQEVSQVNLNFPTGSYS